MSSREGNGREPLFYLKPCDTEAVYIARDMVNWQYMAMVDGEPVLNIGHISSNARDNQVGASVIIATVGSCESADIIIRTLGMPPILASFEVDRATGVISYVFRNDKSITLADGRATHRRVPVVPRIREKMVFGRDQHCIFLICWNGKDDAEALRLAKEMITNRPPPSERPPPSSASQRILEPVIPIDAGALDVSLSPWETNNKYYNLDKIGRGAFSSVYKGVDERTCQLVAIKFPKGRRGRESAISSMENEVRIMSRLSHPRILKFIASCDWNTPSPRSIMALKEGSLSSLMRDPPAGMHLDEIVDTAFGQMLEALEYLDGQGIVHGDIKPDNILYSKEFGRLMFVLADFGVSTRQGDVGGRLGASLFLAPECDDRDAPSTTKSDIWALYVTNIVVRYPEQFNQAGDRYGDDVIGLVLNFQPPQASFCRTYRDMIEYHPTNRTSARDLRRRFAKRHNPEHQASGHDIADGLGRNDDAERIQEFGRHPEEVYYTMGSYCYCGYGDYGGAYCAEYRTDQRRGRRRSYCSGCEYCN